VDLSFVALGEQRGEGVRAAGEDAGQSVGVVGDQGQ
jgi:hypothetical protein